MEREDGEGVLGRPFFLKGQARLIERGEERAAGCPWVSSSDEREREERERETILKQRLARFRWRGESECACKQATEEHESPRGSCHSAAAGSQPWPWQRRAEGAGAAAGVGKKGRGRRAKESKAAFCMYARQARNRSPLVPLCALPTPLFSLQRPCLDTGGRPRGQPKGQSERERGGEGEARGRPHRMEIVAPQCHTTNRHTHTHTRHTHTRYRAQRTAPERETTLCCSSCTSPGSSWRAAALSGSPLASSSGALVITASPSLRGRGEVLLEGVSGAAVAIAAVQRRGRGKGRWRGEGKGGGERKRQRPEGKMRGMRSLVRHCGSASSRPCSASQANSADGGNVVMCSTLYEAKSADARWVARGKRSG